MMCLDGKYKQSLQFWLSFFTVNGLLFKITELKKSFIQENK